MGQYTGTNTWINQVYQFEETDLVKADTDNVPLQNLADRTVYLKNKIGLATNLEGEAYINGSASIPGTLAGNLILAQSGDIANLTLEDVTTFKHGAIVPISAFCSPGAVINIKPLWSQPIYDSSGASLEYNMHNEEQLILCAFSDHWRVLMANGNFNKAGEEIKSRKQLNNTLRLDGALLERARYPRLWKFVSTLTMYQEVVTEDLWFYDAFTYRGCFSIGNGLTTFRLPDERGMYDRMIDAGRGVDYSRWHNFPGGYEPDSLKSHAHDYRDRYYTNALSEFNKYGAYNREYMGRYNNAIGLGANTDTDNEYAAYVDKTTTYTGDSNETNTKNIGKINLIKF